MDVTDLIHVLEPPFGTLVSLLAASLLYAFLSRGLRRFRLSHWLTETMEGRVRWLVRILLLGALFLLILQELGLVSHAWAIITATAAAMAVGFVAHWSILSNWVAAFVILFYRRFGMGDTIELLESADKTTGLRGRVVEINLFYTAIEQIDDSQSLGIVQLPNNLFFQKPTRILHSASRAVADHPRP